MEIYKMKITTLNITKEQLDEIKNNYREYGIAPKRGSVEPNHGDLMEVCYKVHLKNNGANIDVNMNRDGVKWTKGSDIDTTSIKSSHASLVHDLTTRLPLDQAADYYLNNCHSTIYAYVEETQDGLTAFEMNKQDMRKFIIAYGSVQKNKGGFKLRLKENKSIVKYLFSLA